MTEFKSVAKLIKEYNLQVDHSSYCGVVANNSVQIIEGSNEGYYVEVVQDSTQYTMRFHDYNEALKTLGVMLKVINPSH